MKTRRVKSIGIVEGQFIIKECIKCNNKRKFLTGTERDKSDICGECWDWKNYP